MDDDKKFLQKVLTSSLNGLYIYDLEEGANTFINPAYTRITGYTLQDLKSMKGPEFFALFHPEDQVRVATHMKSIRHVADSDILEIEYRFKAADGRWIWCLSRDTVFERSDEGTVRQILGTFMDITGRKRMEDALRKSERSYRELVENANSAILRWKKDGTITFFNEYAQKLFGYRLEEVVGKHVNITLPDKESTGGDLSQLAQEIVNHPENYVSNINENITKDGRRIWMAWTNRPIFDSQGKLSEVLAVGMDITDRKQAEEALQESESKYRNLFENMAEEVHFWRLVRDESGRIKTWRLVDANPPTLKTWGRTLDEIKGKTTDEIFGPGSTDHYMPVVQKIMTESVPYSFEDYFPNLGRYFRFTSVPLGDHFITTGADITAIRKAHEALRQSEVVYRSIAKNFPNGAVYVFDRDLRFLVADGNALDVIGWSTERLEGLRVGDLDEETRKTIEPRYRRVLAGESMRFETAYRDHIMLSDYVPIRGEQGEVFLGLVVSTDITEQKKMEQDLRQSRDQLDVRVKERTAELEESNDRLRSLNQEMQEFVYVASHDLQEPLRKIQMFSGLLKSPQGSVSEEKNRDYLERMQRAAERMREMIDALLEYSRITTRGQPFTRIDLSEPVKKALQILDLKVEETGAEVEIGHLPVIEADYSQMLQLFQNLLENALKFHRKGDPLRVRIKVQQVGNGWIRLLVEDNGIGFEEQYVQRIFNPFERLHGKGDFKGTGIGLSICRKVVERHGGKITAKSTPGKGSTFIIDLPVRQVPKTQ
jgi:PAS domain S-box-containing protein